MSESTDPVFQDLEQNAYRLLFEEHHTAESALEALNHERVSETLVEMAIESAFLVRHEEALRGELEWGDWIAAVARDPGRSGAGVMILTAVTIPVTFAAVVWSLKFFPPGRYPQIVLMLPGIILGAMFFGFGSIPIYSREHKKAESRKQKDGQPPAR